MSSTASHTRAPSADHAPRPAAVGPVRAGRLACAAGAAALLGASAAQAHHSIAAVYDGNERRTLEAIVTEFRFENPHPKILVEVDTADGVQRWTLEMDNRWELAELGFEPDTLEAGERILVSGSLARSAPRSLYVRRLERPVDGFAYEHHR